MCSIPSDDSADPQISQFCCLHWSDLHLQSTSAVHTHATPNRPAPLSIFQTPLGSSLKGGFEKASFFLSAHTPPPLLLLSLLFSLLLLPVSCSHPFFCLCFRRWDGHGARGGWLLPSVVSSSKIIRWLAWLCCVFPHTGCFDNFQLRFLSISCFFLVCFSPPTLWQWGIVRKPHKNWGDWINKYMVNKGIYQHPPLLATHAHTRREKGTMELC